MRESDLIVKTKKDIKNLYKKFEDKSAQLGGAFYDSDLRFDATDTEVKVDNLKTLIPQIKKELDVLHGYSLTIDESEKSIKECNEQIKEYESKLNSTMGKIGVELYCFIGEKELSFPKIKELYHDLKKGESKSESLESELFKYENNEIGKKLTRLVVKPFRIKVLKREIQQNNKISLKKFCEIALAYIGTPELMNEIENDAIEDVLVDYREINNNIELIKSKRDKLQIRIVEQEEKIKEDSNGVKLKTLYSRLESKIVDIQNDISNSLIILGKEISDDLEFEINDADISSKLEIQRSVKKELKYKEDYLVYLESKFSYQNKLKEVSERENRINIEEDHISVLQKKLKNHVDELDLLKEENTVLNKWIIDNSEKFES